MTILNAVLRSARLWPDNPAIFLTDRVVTYRLLLAGIIGASARLKASGLAKGDLVAIEVADPARHIVIALALMRLGIASVSVRQETLVFVAGLGVTLVLSDDGGPSPAGLARQLVTDDWFAPVPDTEIVIGPSHFAEHDVCRVSITSGSTGQPKAVGQSEIATWRRIQERLFSSIAEPWSRTLCMAGLSTNFGFTRALLPLCIGHAACFADSAEAALQMTSVYGIDQLVGSPAQISALVDARSELGLALPSLTSVLSGGGALNPDLIDRIRAGMCSTVIDSYSSTEAGSTGIASGDFLARRGERRLFVPVKDVQIVDPAGQSVAAGVEGRVQVRSDSFASAFKNIETFVADAPGWFTPGDIGRLVEGGVLEILGRDDDVLNVGGVKINAESVEAAIIAFPGVRDAGVVVAKDLTLWAGLVADFDLDLESLAGWVETRVPGTRLARIVRLRAIPRTQLGKLMRQDLHRLLGGST
jgi:acyl-coenzyme A synthetase/AMP-(fatty) acid ligase